MNTTTRLLTAAALMAALAACGNKGPLVQADSPEAEAEAAGEAAAVTEPAADAINDPTTGAPVSEAEPVATPEPAVGDPAQAPIDETDPVPAEPTEPLPPASEQDDGTP